MSETETFSTKRCYACGGTHSIMAIDGYMRPCSRCCPDAFSAWYEAKSNRTFKPSLPPPLEDRK